MSITEKTIYSAGPDMAFFNVSYEAKQLLNDSLRRTSHGYDFLRKGEILRGGGNILLGQVESAAAGVFVALSASFVVITLALGTPCFLIPAMALNLASRLPVVSSFKSVQQFTAVSNSVIARTLKVTLIAIPTIFLFLSAATANTVLPGILGTHNLFFRSIHWCVESLGPLKTISARVEGRVAVRGAVERLSVLSFIEEYFRALSYKNMLQSVIVDDLTHYHNYSRRPFRSY